MIADRVNQVSLVWLGSYLLEVNHILFGRVCMHLYNTYILHESMSIGWPHKSEDCNLSTANLQVFFLYETA